MEPPRTRGPRHVPVVWDSFPLGRPSAPPVRSLSHPGSAGRSPEPGLPFGVPSPSKFPPGGSPSALRARGGPSPGQGPRGGFPGEGGKAGVGREKKGGKKPPWLLPESETNKLGQQNINLADRNGIDLHSQLFFPLIYELPSLKDYSNHGRTV